MLCYQEVKKAAKNVAYKQKGRIMLQPVIDFEYKDKPEEESSTEPVVDFEYRQLPIPDEDIPSRWEFLHEILDGMSEDEEALIRLSSKDEVPRAQAAVHAHAPKTFRTESISGNKLRVWYASKDSKQVRDKRSSWRWLHDEINGLTIGDKPKMYTLKSERESENAARSIRALNTRLREQKADHKFKYRADGKWLYVRKVQR